VYSRDIGRGKSRESTAPLSPPAASRSATHPPTLSPSASFVTRPLRSSPVRFVRRPCRPITCAARTGWQVRRAEAQDGARPRAEARLRGGRGGAARPVPPSSTNRTRLSPPTPTNRTPPPPSPPTNRTRLSLACKPVLPSRERVDALCEDGGGCGQRGPFPPRTFVRTNAGRARAAGGGAQEGAQDARSARVESGPPAPSPRQLLGARGCSAAA